MIKLRVRDPKLLAFTFLWGLGIWTTLGWMTLIDWSGGSGYVTRTGDWVGTPSVLISAEPLGLILWLGPAVIFAVVVFLSWLFMEVLVLEFTNPFDRV